ncbi:MAG: cytochrome c [Acidobacteria bacterium]|nr:cytochrome c [Acidobacteriota bacterium]
MSTRFLLPILLAFGVYAHDAHGKKTSPPSAKLLKSPLTTAQARPELGKAKYEQTCAACHGTDGKAKSATDLTDHKMHSMKDGEIYWVITNGVGKTMPAFKAQLTETERWQIVLYVRQLAK